MTRTEILEWYCKKVCNKHPYPCVESDIGKCGVMAELSSMLTALVESAPSEIRSNELTLGKFDDGYDYHCNKVANWKQETLK